MTLLQALLGGLKARLDRINCIGAEVSLASDSWVSGSTLDGLVSVGSGCKIFHSVVSGRVCIGRYSSLWGPGLFVLARKHGASIGNFCSIARHVSIQEDNHDPQRTTTYFVERNLFGQPLRTETLYSRGAIRIGHDVWIGAGAQIHSGVTVADGAIVAGGAVVTRDVAPFAIVAGNPARQVRYRFDKKTIERLSADQWWDWPLERLQAEREYLLALHEAPRSAQS